MKKKGYDPVCLQKIVVVCVLFGAWIVGAAVADFMGMF